MNDSVFDTLSYSPNWGDRYNVAGNSTTTPETLDRLANDEVFWVRQICAQNPNTPPETLERLSYDEDYGVRCCVAINSNTPQYIKDYLKIKNYAALSFYCC